jgi:cellulose synthase/poly-beta-1,6-N-acetylglucosamine synthase-like glycosyltransferase
VIFPVAKESRRVLQPSVESLVRQAFPTSRMLVILAVEERAPDEVKQGARELQQRYRGKFLELLVTIHPSGLPGEARVKGANASYAAKAAAAYFERQGIAFERVIVSCFDADTVVSPSYFGCLTYSFLMCPDRTRASFQPIPMFHNNIWDTPGFTRVLDIGSSFFQLVEATNQEHLVTFSSHSMSFKALVDVGYWPVDMISDDSAIFWKALIHYDGDYRVVPMYVTLSMDAVNAGTWWKTVVNVYQQKRRWAWGVENFPIVMRAFLRADRIPLVTRARHAFKLFAGQIAWATWAFLLTVISWLPALFAGREFSDSVLYYSAPRITAIIFHVSGLALVVTIVLSLYLLPKPGPHYRFLQRVAHAIEWLFIPLIATLLSALPALDAQTRLMLGRYMEFWVTDKARPVRPARRRRGIALGRRRAYDDDSGRHTNQERP